MSTISSTFYSNIMEKDISLIYDYEPEEVWLDHGKYCQSPLYFEIIQVIDSNGKEVDFWLNFQDIIFIEFMKDSQRQEEYYNDNY